MTLADRSQELLLADIERLTRQRDELLAAAESLLRAYHNSVRRHGHTEFSARLIPTVNEMAYTIARACEENP